MSTRSKKRKNKSKSKSKTDTSISKQEQVDKVFCQKCHFFLLPVERYIDSEGNVIKMNVEQDEEEQTTDTEQTQTSSTPKKKKSSTKKLPADAQLQLVFVCRRSCGTVHIPASDETVEVSRSGAKVNHDFRVNDSDPGSMVEDITLERERINCVDSKCKGTIAAFQRGTISRRRLYACMTCRAMWQEIDNIKKMYQGEQ